MDINGINSSYLEGVLNNANSVASTSGLEEKLNSFKDILDQRISENTESTEAKEASQSLEIKENADGESVNDEALMDACKEFEAYFIEQVFKEMKKSVNLTQSEDAATKQLMDYYEDSLTTEYSKMAADQQENGLAQMLFEQMKRNLS